MITENQNNSTTQSLDAMCHSMAEQLSLHFATSGLEEYQRFLNMMFHYTLKSGDRLKFAAERAEHPKLKQVFTELAKEEQYHYRLAQRDLNNMGQQPSEQSPPEAQAFHDYWMTIAATHQFEYVGAMYVLENIAGHIKPYLMPHFTKLALEPDHSKFIMTHLVADEDHGERLKMLSVEAHGDEVTDVLKGGQHAKKFWLDIHLAALV
jgi:heme oxygenase